MFFGAVILGTAVVSIRALLSFRKRPVRGAVVPLLCSLLCARFFAIVPLFTEPIVNSSNLPLNHIAGERVPVADLHCDAMLWTSSGRSILRTTSDPIRGTPLGSVDVPRLIQGGVAVQVFAVR